ncbi:hypothetical protein [Neobacillus terrae]|uniref:hypothetical protein n=1 Tax=Neobacillus terrae TaxID=3034837 RepID=UPI00140954B4|nr:hypothetical protein [Neobacillus terrae]
MVKLDQLIPQVQLVRKMESALDSSFIYDLFKDVYSEVGRPSFVPIILIKLTFIQYTFGMRWTALRAIKYWWMQASLFSLR